MRQLKKSNLTPYINRITVTLTAGVPNIYATQGTFIFVSESTGETTDLLNLKCYQEETQILDISGFDDFWVFNMPGYDSGEPIYFDKLVFFSPNVDATVTIFVGAGDVKIPGSIAVVNVINTVNEIKQLDACYIPHGKNILNGSGGSTNLVSTPVAPSNNQDVLLKSIYATLVLSSVSADGFVESCHLYDTANNIIYDDLEPIQTSQTYTTGGSEFDYTLKNIDALIKAGNSDLKVIAQTSTNCDLNLKLAVNFQLVSKP